MSNNRRSRRDNRLIAEEIDVAITPLEHDTLDFDEAFNLFIADGERRGLRPATMVYYREQRYLTCIKTHLGNDFTLSKGSLGYV